jgi:hypothetical protein
MLPAIIGRSVPVVGHCHLHQEAALAELIAADVALSGQDVTTSHAMLTEVAQAFV